MYFDVYRGVCVYIECSREKEKLIMGGAVLGMGRRFAGTMSLSR